MQLSINQNNLYYITFALQFNNFYFKIPVILGHIIFIA